MRISLLIAMWVGGPCAPTPVPTPSAPHPAESVPAESVPAESVPAESVPAAPAPAARHETPATPAPSPQTPTRASAGPCTTRTRSTLPGVTLVFPEQPCTLTLAQARDVTFRWQVVVAEAPGSLVHTSSRSCAGLGPGGFVAEATLGAGEHTYCLCDTGLCPPRDLRSAPEPGIYSDAMPWDGRAWFGPSDFNNPKGAAFPPGTYPLTVRLAGTRNGTPWEVVGELDIVLTDGATSPSPPRTRPAPPPVRRPAPTPPPMRAPKPTPPTRPDPDPPFPRPDLDAPEARACATAADCVVSCAMSCCGAPCGCRSALNRETAAKAEAWGKRGCPVPADCPAMGCAYEPAFGATCRQGRCEALRSLSDY